MTSGVNQSHTHGDVVYHVQIENLKESRALDVRVYVSGRIVFHKRHTYGLYVENISDPQRFQAMVKDEIEKILALVKAAIDRGRIKA